jgi:hypothetical protein
MRLVHCGPPRYAFDGSVVTNSWNPLLQISNSQLTERVKALGTGLCLAGLARESNVLLLLNDSLGEHSHCLSSVRCPYRSSTVNSRVPHHRACTRFTFHHVLDSFVPFASLTSA